MVNITAKQYEKEVGGCRPPLNFGLGANKSVHHECSELALREIQKTLNNNQLSIEEKYKDILSAVDFYIICELNIAENRKLRKIA